MRLCVYTYFSCCKPFVKGNDDRGCIIDKQKTTGSVSSLCIERLFIISYGTFLIQQNSFAVNAVAMNYVLDEKATVDCRMLPNPIGARYTLTLSTFVDFLLSIQKAQSESEYGHRPLKEGIILYKMQSSTVNDRYRSNFWSHLALQIGWRVQTSSQGSNSGGNVRSC